MTTAIRQARPSELALLPVIEQRAGALFDAITWFNLPEGDGLAMDFIEAIARSGAALVATVDDVPVGFALLGFLDRAVHLYELDVAPPHGGKGLGRGLVEASCDWAKAEGAPAVTLSTFREVPWNGPFYASAGFHVMPRAAWTPALHLLHLREIDIGLPIERRIFMRKDL